MEIQPSTLEVLAENLMARGLMLATAESCTGGLIAVLCTDIAGSSRWFERAFVTYSNGAKNEMLGVPLALIREHGAVSESVVRAMAAGAVHRSGADVAVAVSGVAGPDGGSAEKPVGTVWIGFAVPAEIGNGVDVDAVKFCFEGDRSAVRMTAATEAIQGVLVRTRNTG